MGEVISLGRESDGNERLRVGKGESGRFATADVLGTKRFGRRTISTHSSSHPH